MLIRCSLCTFPSKTSGDISRDMSRKLSSFEKVYFDFPVRVISYREVAMFRPHFRTGAAIQTDMKSQLHKHDRTDRRKVKQHTV